MGSGLFRSICGQFERQLEIDKLYEPRLPTATPAFPAQPSYYSNETSFIQPPIAPAATRRKNRQCILI